MRNLIDVMFAADGRHVLFTYDMFLSHCAAVYTRVCQ